MLIDMTERTLQALFRCIRRGGSRIIGRTLKGVASVDIVHQFLVNLEIHALSLNMTILRLWLVLFIAFRWII